MLLVGWYSFLNGDVPRLTRFQGKESNARIIRWSDGSLSLLLGEELFEMNIQKLPAEHPNFIVAVQEDGESPLLS